MNGFRHLRQNQVAHVMAARIIDLFKPVDIHIGDGERVLISPGPEDFTFRGFKKRPAVADPGQMIHAGEFLEPVDIPFQVAQ